MDGSRTRADQPENGVITSAIFTKFFKILRLRCDHHEIPHRYWPSQAIVMGTFFPLSTVADRHHHLGFGPEYTKSAVSLPPMTGSRYNMFNIGSAAKRVQYIPAQVQYRPREQGVRCGGTDPSQAHRGLQPLRCQHHY